MRRAAWPRVAHEKEIERSPPSLAPTLCARRERLSLTTFPPPARPATPLNARASYPDQPTAGVAASGFHPQTLLIYKLGFNRNYYTFTSILLMKIVLCSESKAQFLMGVISTRRGWKSERSWKTWCRRPGGASLSLLTLISRFRAPPTP